MRARHGTLIPTDLTISAQRAVSLSIRARNCAGEAWETVTPSGSRRVANSCDSRMALRSAVRRAAICGGRSAGASTPHQCSTTRSMPLSLKVGIFARRRQPRFACGRERAHAVENRARRCERGEARLHMASDEIVHRRAGAAKRHVHELDAGFGLKKLRGEVGGAANPA